jgi:hypothetical protein
MRNPPRTSTSAKVNQVTISLARLLLSGIGKHIAHIDFHGGTSLSENTFGPELF